MKSRILKSLDLVLRCMRVSVLTGPRSQTCRPPCWRLSQNGFGAARLPKDFKPVQRRAGRHTLCWEAEEAWCLFDFLFFFFKLFQPKRHLQIQVGGKCQSAHFRTHGPAERDGQAASRPRRCGRLLPSASSRTHAQHTCKTVGIFRQESTW